MATDKVRYTKEGMEILLRQAELDQDADQFVVSMKVSLYIIWDNFHGHPPNLFRPYTVGPNRYDNLLKKP